MRPDLDAIVEGPHDYSSSAEAVVDATVAAFNYAADKLRLTGFQAGWAALTAYCKVMGNDCPVIVFKADDLLYPQYDLPARLAKWIEECGPWLAEQAAERLTDPGHAVPWVVAHWRTLAAAGASRSVDEATS